MICKPCRKAATDARRVWDSTPYVGMGALNSAMNGHNECAARDITWCDCHHQPPRETNA